LSRIAHDDGRLRRIVENGRPWDNAMVANNSAGLFGIESLIYNGVMKTLYKKSITARELPTRWQEEGCFAPDDRVTVVITPAGRETVAGSPKRFIGAGKGLFASAREINAYIRRNRDAWNS
jgi:hypothetical protein